MKGRTPASTESQALAPAPDASGDLARIVEQITERLLSEPHADLQSLLAEYPHHASQLEYLLSAVQVMADVAATATARPNRQPALSTALPQALGAGLRAPTGRLVPPKRSTAGLSSKASLPRSAG